MGELSSRLLKLPSIVYFIWLLHLILSCYPCFLCWHFKFLLPLTAMLTFHFSSSCYCQSLKCVTYTCATAPTHLHVISRLSASWNHPTPGIILLILPPAYPKSITFSQFVFIKSLQFFRLSWSSNLFIILVLLLFFPFIIAATFPFAPLLLFLT